MGLEPTTFCMARKRERRTPLVLVVAVSFFAGIDVWRVPIAWTQKTRREIVEGIRSGTRLELEA